MVEPDYFAVNRKLLNSEMWLEDPFTRGQAWVDLIGLARHSDGDAWIRGRIVRLLRGQLAWSVIGLSIRWKWSQGKVKRFLEQLQNGELIATSFVDVTLVLTIVNYDKYQTRVSKTESKRGRNGEQTERRRRGGGEQTETKEEGKKDKKERREECDIEERTPVDFVVTHYQTHHPHSKPGAKERKRIADRLAEGYSVDDLIAAIEGNHKSPFHCGVNKENKKWHGIHVIFRDSDQVQSFIEMASGDAIRRGPRIPTLEEVNEAYGVGQID